MIGKILKNRLVLAGLLLIIVGIIISKVFFRGTSGTTQYQTTPAEKGTLVVSVTGSGQVSTSNNGTVDTLASGVVSTLYVKDGDMVQSGDKIAEIDLDMTGQQNQAQALSSLQSAKNNLDSANANMYSLQSTMFTNWDTFMNTAQSGAYQNADGTPRTNERTQAAFNIANDDWLAAEAKYKNQQGVVTQAQTAYHSSWISYQQSSSTIYAPISGKISGLSLQVGSVITSTQNTTSGAQSKTKIASVTTDARPTVSINLTEIDIPKIKIGNPATVTFDAFPDKTYTGKVISIDNVGVVSSGVTTYPTVIMLDTKSNAILPNMAAAASIIVTTKDNVIKIPSGAVKTQNGESIVTILKNGQPQQVTVQIGLQSDTETEIISGIAAGDTVATSTISATSGTTSGQSSPFSSFGGNRGFGGAQRIIGR